jgi:hypothetical protein
VGLAESFGGAGLAERPAGGGFSEQIICRIGEKKKNRFCFFIRSVWLCACAALALAVYYLRRAKKYSRRRGFGNRSDMGALQNQSALRCAAFPKKILNMEVFDLEKQEK